MQLCLPIKFSIRHVFPTVFLVSCISHQNNSIVNGNAATASVEVIPGEDYTQTFSMLLKKAKPTDVPIDILQYSFFSESGISKDLAQELKDMKKKNPSRQIRVVLERDKDGASAKGVGTRNKLTKNFLADSGITVSLISGVQAPDKNGFMHAKVIRIGNTILAGSTNLSNTSLTKNNEFNLLIKSSDVSDTIDAYMTALIADSSKLYELRATAAGITLITDSLFYNQALTLIQSAISGDSIDLATYYFASGNDPKAKTILEELYQAQLRGASIRVFLEQNSDLDFNQTITKSNHTIASRLIANGINSVYFDSLTKISHSKIIRVVGNGRKIALLGSSNIYHSDFDLNHQVNFIIEDPAIVDAIGLYFEKMATEEFSLFHEP